MANVMGNSIVKNLQNSMILEDFIKSSNFYDQGGGAICALISSCVSINMARMGGALQMSVSLVTMLFPLGSHCHTAG